MVAISKTEVAYLASNNNDFYFYDDTTETFTPKTAPSAANQRSFSNLVLFTLKDDAIRDSGISLPSTANDFSAVTMSLL